MIVWAYLEFTSVGKSDICNSEIFSASKLFWTIKYPVEDINHPLLAPQPWILFAIPVVLLGMTYATKVLLIIYLIATDLW